MHRRLLGLALSVSLLAGCGAGAQSSTDSFSGEDKKVAQVLEDLQAAGQSGDADEVCSRILADRLVDELAAEGSSCAQEIEDALDDADDFELDVQRVQVTGSRATATVGNGDGPAQAVQLTREGKRWKVSELAAPKS